MAGMGGANFLEGALQGVGDVTKGSARLLVGRVAKALGVDLGLDEPEQAVAELPETDSDGMVELNLHPVEIPADTPYDEALEIALDNGMDVDDFDTSPTPEQD